MQMFDWSLRNEGSHVHIIMRGVPSCRVCRVSSMSACLITLMNVVVVVSSDFYDHTLFSVF